MFCSVPMLSKLCIVKKKKAFKKTTCDLFLRVLPVFQRDDGRGLGPTAKCLNMTGSLSETVEVRTFKFCMVITSTRLYAFLVVSVTLTEF